MKKWYNYETENPIIKDKLRRYFHENEIKYELSTCFDGWHFEIWLDENKVENVNTFLDSIY